MRWRLSGFGQIRGRAGAEATDWLLGLGAQIFEGGHHWMGVRALKNPLDAWVYQEIIHETRPEAVVELGSLYGGGTLFLAHMLDLLGGDRIVVSVDVNRDHYRAEHDRIVEITGDTASPEVVAKVQSLCSAKRTMVIHDADHHAHAVLQDLRNYGPLVSAGCYLIVEDGITDAMPSEKWGEGRADPGPFAASRQFRQEAPEFVVDAKREWQGTFNPRGFLRRRPE
jgi:cephalosporin hydroxylase